MGIVPIKQIKPRLPEIGRIRPGISVERTSKSGKKYQSPANSETWVLTAQQRDNLDRLADVYGGVVEAWEEDRTRDAWRLVTEATALTVILPPGALSEPCYEKWERGQIRRRCDGETLVGFPRDGSQPVEVDCICATVDDTEKHCTPKSHLNVLFPETPVGVWRLTTTSRNAMAELAASVEIINMAAHVGLPRAMLTRQFRTSGEKQFWVPIVTTEATFEELESGARSAVAALSAGDGTRAGGRPGLPAGAVISSGDEFDGLAGDLDIADAELIE